VFPKLERIEQPGISPVRTTRSTSMTATLSLSRRSDRCTPRPVGLHRIHGDRADVQGDAAPTTVDYGGRRMVAALLAVTLVALVAVTLSALVGAAVDVGGRTVAATDVASASGAAPVARIHVAQPGDTLWAIADLYRGEIGRGRFVDALIALNGGTVIQAGQAVRLP
jgi:hypothetical protein